MRIYITRTCVFCQGFSERYDTGARVSEILSLKVRDVHLSTPAKVILYGKGRKLREVPILPNTALHLQQYLTEHKLSAPEKLDRTLFVNRQGNPLTRAGATYILNKYVQMAELDTHVSPHILRHTKAMHLLSCKLFGIRKSAAFSGDTYHARFP